MDLFDNLKALIKPSACVIDNYIFRLHYKATAVILVAFSLMVTGRQYFGDPIDCISNDDFPSNLLDTWCWIHTTFSLESAWKKRVGVEVPYPGVDKYTPGEKRVYHAYYQWVCFVLFFQALLFYIPRLFWKAMERGRVKSLILELNSPILAEDKKSANRSQLVEYLSRNRGQHDVMFKFYVVAEVLNLLNVFLQMYIMDRFLGGEFTSYGWEVLSFSEWDWSVRYDPMIKIFPRLTKCTFHRFGSSGDVQRHDAMCILPINIVNEKIYIFLWFWFYFLAILSVLALVYRFFIIMVPRARARATHARCSILEPDVVNSIVKKCRLGDWFLLDLLAKNLDSLNYRDLMIDYHKRIQDSKDSHKI